MQNLVENPLFESKLRTVVAFRYISPLELDDLADSPHLPVLGEDGITLLETALQVLQNEGNAVPLRELMTLLESCYTGLNTLLNQASYRRTLNNIVASPYHNGALKHAIFGSRLPYSKDDLYMGILKYEQNRLAEFRNSLNELNNHLNAYISQFQHTNIPANN